ncbi:hypothetical protein JAAARDRAFT_75283 [Jaapia argillacea MUCL 33604]|uniref:Uncharacterized protein n=1 Tax=Jaapia argillacea MUCL 33604 TaxID=933084 RepID=A0A067QCJ3_9AGAM|nr:hypothetical protein JAAARDRAFT_75283 [Jaapia argillacea MUCL 33604]
MAGVLTLGKERYFRDLYESLRYACCDCTIEGYLYQPWGWALVPFALRSPFQCSLMPAPQLPIKRLLEKKPQYKYPDFGLVGHLFGQPGDPVHRRLPLWMEIKRLEVEISTPFNFVARRAAAIVLGRKRSEIDRQVTVQAKFIFEQFWDGHRDGVACVIMVAGAYWTMREYKSASTSALPNHRVDRKTPSGLTSKPIVHVEGVLPLMNAEGDELPEDDELSESDVANSDSPRLDEDGNIILEQNRWESDEESDEEDEAEDEDEDERFEYDGRGGVWGANDENGGFEYAEQEEDDGDGEDGSADGSVRDRGEEGEVEGETQAGDSESCSDDSEKEGGSSDVEGSDKNGSQDHENPSPNPAPFPFPQVALPDDFHPEFIRLVDYALCKVSHLNGMMDPWW